MSLLLKRTSIRHFLDNPISDEQVEYILTAAMQAPSANNQQPWEFIVVRDKETKEKLSATSKGAWMIKDAPLLITVVMQDGGKSEVMKPQDCAAATQNILLSCTELGLGAVWIGVHPKSERENFVNEVLNIQNGTAFSMIAIGEPNETKKVKIRFDKNRVHFERMK
jgi:nitroreductase